MMFLRFFCRSVLAGLALFVGHHSLFAAAIWNKTNTVGYWRYGTNWSSSPNAPTLASGGTYVTNLSTKTVIVDADAPTTNLVINSLNVWAPVNATNTLLLQDLGAQPLIVSNNTLDVRMRGVIQVTNSSLIVTGNFIAFNVWAGTVTLDSGSIIAHEPGLMTNSTIPTRIGRTNVAELHINGGAMEVGTLEVGQAGLLNSRSHGTIHMSGGELRVLGELSVGNSVNCTGAVHLTGGILNVPVGNTNVARVGDDGVGVMTVSNAAVMLNNLSVGRHTNSLGRLVIHDTGRLNALDDVSIGRFGGATGIVFMAGGELLCSNQTLWVGREALGTLTVSNGVIRADNLHVASVATNGASGYALFAGGTTVLSSNFLIGAPGFATGDVVMAGGTLIASNASQSALTEISSGTLTMQGGSLVTDKLSLTNRAGRMQFSAGTVQSASSFVSNGLPFVVGDGVHAAAFVLGPGRHVFANGIEVSPNASLTGCNDIIGTVINNSGTITITNCATLAEPPTFLQQPVSLTVTQGAAATFSISVAGTPPPTLQWRFTPLGGAEVDLPGAVEPVLSLPAIQASDAGNYRAVARNDSGSVTSMVAVLRVLIPPAVVSTTHTGGVTQVEFQSVARLNYFLEYKNQLEDAAWKPLGSVVGTGAVLMLEDPAATATTRFYRVRVE
jgi:hypothetical protein